MLKGSAENALSNNNSAVITAAMAAKYFGDKEPIGQTLTLDFGTKVDVIVTGIIADHPPTTDFSPQILVPLELYFRGGRAKVELALARGKRRTDRRETIRRREQEREMQRASRVRWPR